MTVGGRILQKNAIAGRLTAQRYAPRVTGHANVLLGVVDAPVYADGAHGLARPTGAGGSHLVGFVLAAAVIGWKTLEYSLSSFIPGDTIERYLAGSPK